MNEVSRELSLKMINQPIKISLSGKKVKHGSRGAARVTKSLRWSAK